MLSPGAEKLFDDCFGFRQKTGGWEHRLLQGKRFDPVRAGSIMRALPVRAFLLQKGVIGMAVQNPDRMI